MIFCLGLLDALVASSTDPPSKSLVSAEGRARDHCLRFAPACALQSYEQNTMAPARLLQTITRPTKHASAFQTSVEEAMNEIGHCSAKPVSFRAQTYS